MGSYTTLSINNYAIFTSKSYVNSGIMTIFTEKDKLMFKSKQYIDDEETIYQYKVKIDKVIDRLNIMGFTLERTKEDFKVSKSNTIDELEIILEYDIDKKEYNLLQQSSFEDFIKAFQILQKKSIDIYSYNKLDKLKLSELELYILDSNGWFLNFPFSDFRYYLRILLEYSPKDLFLIQDMTDIVNSGYYDFKDNIRDIEVNSLVSDYKINSKIIILTEGTSDITIIKRSLKILYPHLIEYYSFMDFGLSNLSGGASSLVSQIKAFISASIENRIIAIFDNDTAAFVARKGLKDIKIPNNIAVINYPNIDLANNYPTLGATGEQKVNINGLACSIEMYLGKDILEDDNKKLIPIQWKGYEKSLNQYQGELISKGNIQKSFYKKLDDCEKNISHIDNYSWKEMRLLLEEIFNTFN